MEQATGAVGFDLDGGVVLLEPSTGRLHVLNGTAGLIWKALAAGIPAADLADHLAETYALEGDRAREDVAQVARWRSAVPGDEARPVSPTPEAGTGAPVRRRVYTLGELQVSLTGTFSAVTRHIDTVLSPHRAADDGPADVAIAVTGGDDGEPFTVCVEGGPPRCFELAAEAIGAIFQAIVEHRHPDVRWLAILHGASVSLDGRGIVLSAASGSGKSTLTAALARRGFAYHADDMVALAAPEGAIVPWPAPHSLKRGAWAALASAFPEIAGSPTLSLAGREIRLVAADSCAWKASPVPSRLLVFPHYTPGSEAGTVRLSALEALVRLIEDRLYLGHPVTAEAVERFLVWLVRMPAYDLVYPDTDAAERLLRALLAELDP